MHPPIEAVKKTQQLPFLRAYNLPALLLNILLNTCYKETDIIFPLSGYKLSSDQLNNQEKGSKSSKCYSQPSFWAATLEAWRPALLQTKGSVSWGLPAVSAWISLGGMMSGLHSLTNGWVSAACCYVSSSRDRTDFSSYICSIHYSICHPWPPPPGSLSSSFGTKGKEALALRLSFPSWTSFELYLRALAFICRLIDGRLRELSPVPPVRPLAFARLGFLVLSGWPILPKHFPRIKEIKACCYLLFCFSAYSGSFIFYDSEQVHSWLYS